MPVASLSILLHEPKAKLSLANEAAGFDLTGTPVQLRKWYRSCGRVTNIRMSAYGYEQTFIVGSGNVHL